jgi:hypothetical protein
MFFLLCYAFVNFACLLQVRDRVRVRVRVRGRVRVRVRVPRAALLRPRQLRMLASG